MRFKKKPSKLKYKLCKLYLSITRFIISLSKVNDVHLGTRVIYNKRRYYVNDCNSYLRGVRVFKLSNANYPFPIYARRDEFEKESDLENVIHDATSWWKWYKRNWLELDAEAMARFHRISSTSTLGHSKINRKHYRFK